VSRYDGPVVDAHHHFWEPRLGRQPWLLPDARIPFRYGQYDAIKRDYLPDDLRRDAASAGVRLVGSVTMETEWDEDDPVGEMRYTAGVAAADAGAAHPLPNAAVAHALLERDDVDDVLGALAALPIVRAVRQKPGQASSPSTVGVVPTLLDDPAWRRGFARLADHGLHFELQTAWWELDRAAALFTAHPSVRVVINHAALPSDRSPSALGGWRAAVGRIAELPHVSMKVSGIGLPGVPWTAASNAPIVDGIVEAFGPARVLFASNFPVDSLTATYADIWNGFRTLTASWSPDDQLAAFAGNAVRVYRLDPALLSA
jgi:predicted TIM-barrel fold metal-dependent hydrolase